MDGAKSKRMQYVIIQQILLRTIVNPVQDADGIIQDGVLQKEEAFQQHHQPGQEGLEVHLEGIAINMTEINHYAQTKQLSMSHAVGLIIRILDVR